MRMFGTAIDLEMVEQVPAKASLWQHPSHGMFNDTFRSDCQHVLDLAGFEAAGIL
jgi:hypothetical protein